MPESVRLAAQVRGLVQGVSFRYYTLQRAQTLGLKGHVRNLSDGSVEVIAEGERGHLDQLLEWLRVGPPSAEVEGVEARWEPALGNYRRFEVRL